MELKRKSILIASVVAFLLVGCTMHLPNKYYLRSERVKEVGVSMPVYDGVDCVGSVTGVEVVDGDAIVEITLRDDLKVGRNARFQMRKINPLEEAIEINSNDRRDPYDKGDTIQVDLGNTEMF